MKVGIDGVLIGLWASVPEEGRILDVGTGCGVIALICAQRSLKSMVQAIDVDPQSVEEASANFADSIWSSRLSARCISFNECRSAGEKYDLIISNPPYFASGVSDLSSRRLAARHQGSLSPEILLDYASDMLCPGGRLAMVLPAEFGPQLESKLLQKSKYATHLALSRATLVKGHESAPFKRILMEFLFNPDERFVPMPVRNTLTLERSHGCPTEEYQLLGHDFYLRF